MQIYDMHISAEAPSVAGAALSGNGALRAGLSGSAAGQSGVASPFAAHLEVATATAGEAASANSAAPNASLETAIAGVPLAEGGMASEGDASLIVAGFADVMVDTVAQLEGMSPGQALIDDGEADLAATLGDQLVVGEGTVTAAPVVETAVDPVMFPAIGTQADEAEVSDEVDPTPGGDAAIAVVVPPFVPLPVADGDSLASLAEGDAIAAVPAASGSATDGEPAFFPGETLPTGAAGSSAANPAASLPAVDMAQVPAQGPATPTVPTLDVGGAIATAEPAVSAPVVTPDAPVVVADADVVDVAAQLGAASAATSLLGNAAQQPVLADDASLITADQGSVDTKPVTTADQPNAQTASQSAVQVTAPPVATDAMVTDVDGGIVAEAKEQPLDQASAPRPAVHVAQNAAAAASVGADQNANAQSRLVSSLVDPALKEAALDGEGLDADLDENGSSPPKRSAGTAAAAGVDRTNAATGAKSDAAAAAIAASAPMVSSPDLLATADGSDALELTLGTSARGAEALVQPATSSTSATQTLPMALMAMEITRNAQRGVSRFEIRLDPPELGRVDVHLKIADDGKVRAHLIVERPETLDMLLRDQRSMERALENAGLKTAAEGGLEFSLKDQGQQASADGESAGDHGRGGNKEDGADDLIVDQQTALERIAAYARSAAGGLDIRV